MTCDKMTCDFCVMRDILAKMSSFNLFFVYKLRVKNFMGNYEKQIQINLQK